MSVSVLRFSAAEKAVWGRAILVALFAMLLLPAASEASGPQPTILPVLFEQPITTLTTTTTTKAITTSTSLFGRLGGL